MVVTLASGRRVDGFELQSWLVASPAPFLCAPFLPPPPALTRWSIIAGNCHKYHFCGDKQIVATNTCLSRQNMSFVATRVYLSRQNLCRDQNISSGQTSFCRDKHTFVATKMIFVAAPANDSRERIVCSLG